MNYAMLIRLRGLACLWLAERLSPLMTRLRQQAARDYGRTTRPAGDLFDQDNPSDWGGR